MTAFPALEGCVNPVIFAWRGLCLGLEVSRGASGAVEPGSGDPGSPCVVSGDLLAHLGLQSLPPGNQKGARAWAPVGQHHAGQQVSRLSQGPQEAAPAPETGSTRATDSFFPAVGLSSRVWTPRSPKRLHL